MKDAKITIAYISHCLASGKKSREGYDEFEKDDDGRLIWRQSWWYAALSRAIEMAGVKGVKPAYFSFSPVVQARTAMYKRKYGYDKYRTHEAIFPGEQVTFEVMIDGLIAPSSVEKIFECMGKYVGLTPYGHGLGFGKFRLVSIKYEKENENDASSREE